MKWAIGFVSLFIIGWFSNTYVLLKLFPYSTQSEYYRFIQARNIVYEGMFLTLITALYLTSKGVMKGISCFIMILVAASVIDKAIFDVTTYLKSDLILVLIALTVSILVYGRNK